MVVFARCTRYVVVINGRSVVPRKIVKFGYVVPRKRVKFGSVVPTKTVQMTWICSTLLFRCIWICGVVSVCGGQQQLIKECHISPHLLLDLCMRVTNPDAWRATLCNNSRGMLQKSAEIGLTSRWSNGNVPFGCDLDLLAPYYYYFAVQQLARIGRRRPHGAYPPSPNKGPTNLDPTPIQRVVVECRESNGRSIENSTTHL